MLEYIYILQLLHTSKDGVLLVTTIQYPQRDITQYFLPRLVSNSKFEISTVLPLWPNYMQDNILNQNINMQ